MTDEKRYTLEDIRKAYADAASQHRMGYDKAYRLACDIYPDPEPPEPERRWVQLSSDIRAALCDNGTVTGRENDDPDDECEVIVQTADDIRALASLLPRVPVKITEEMVERAAEAFEGREGLFAALRAALSAVAADLAQPVHACQHRAQWWGIASVGANRMPEVCDTPDRAEKVLTFYTPGDYRIAALAEVEQP